MASLFVGASPKLLVLLGVDLLGVIGDLLVFSLLCVFIVDEEVFIFRLLLESDDRLFSVSRPSRNGCGGRRSQQGAALGKTPACDATPHW